MADKIEIIIKVVGDKSRLRIINILSKRSLCVCELTEVLKLSQSTVSGHLKVLKDIGIVEEKKDGLRVEYRLNKKNNSISDVLNLILKTLESHKSMYEERNACQKTNREAIYKK